MDRDYTHERAWWATLPPDLQASVRLSADTKSLSVEEWLWRLRHAPEELAVDATQATGS